MTTLRWLTAGESHGPMLVATIEGLPAGLALDDDALSVDLARRQRGYGRGGRMKIERDRARIVAGVRHGRSLGGPVALLLENRDHESWRTRMKVAALTEGEDPGARVTLPRPGHADLAGAIKYERDDLRDVLERASARETAARVALGGIAKALLRAVGVRVGSAVVSIHEARSRDLSTLCPEGRFDAEEISARADVSEVRALDAEAEMIAAIREAMARRDTVGGVVEVVVSGLPPGVGSFVHADRRLDARLMGALASVQAIKAVEVGDGWRGATRYGTEVHDPITRAGTAIARASNHAGGTEGGVSNGEPLVMRAAMKPIATVSNALPSVDLATGEIDRAHVERSDTCAVPAAAVVCEAMAALCVADALLETWGADTVDQLRARVREAWRRARRLPGHVYLCGLSGAGKSTVAKLLSRAMELPVIDLDAEIERASGASVRDLFSREGEPSFRARELDALRSVARGPRAVIALGGGAVLSAEARDILRRSGDVVWLRAPVSALAARLSHATDRPLLDGDLTASLTALDAVRRDVYELVSDVIVDATAAPDEVTQRALGALGAMR
ncbi:MAG: chorismate synthase [Polyangiales bacterium]